MIGAPDGGALMCNVTCRATSSSCSGVASRVDSPLTLAENPRLLWGQLAGSRAAACCTEHARPYSIHAIRIATDADVDALVHI